eukprot:10124205-Karenia_brevis.AAC.1
MQIEVLPYSSHVKYLGRKLTFDNPQKTELDNRIAAAWRAFNKYRQELLGKHYSLNDRLKLFHSTVTPTVLDATSWTLTRDLELQLQC